MAKKKYRLRILQLFESDLNETADYIAYKLQNPIAANDLIDATETAIYERLPACVRLLAWRKICSQGFATFSRRLV